MDQGQGRGLGSGGGFLRYCCAWSIKSERSTLKSTSTDSECDDAWALSQYKSSIALRSSPKDTTLSTIRFHAFTGVRNGDISNGCTIVSGAMVTLMTATMPDVVVADGIFAYPGPVVARAS